MTLDGNHLRLPNALVFSSVMLNYTRNPSRRFDFDVGIGVSEDLVRAQQIGVDVLRTLDGVQDTPPPRAYITALGDSNVQIRYQAWVDQRSHDFASVKSEGIRLVKLALEAAEMDMPEPIYRVQLSERSAAASPANAAPKAPKGETPNSAIDTRVQADLDEQIAADQRTRASEDRFTWGVLPDKEANYRDFSGRVKPFSTQCVQISFCPPGRRRRHLAETRIHDQQPRHLP